MGFELFLQCLEENPKCGISRSAVRSLFPIVEEESRPDYWHIHYNGQNSCHIGVTPLPTNSELLEHMCVERPCRDLLLWEGLFAVLRMGPIVIFWPGGPPVVADEATLKLLPKDMTDASVPPRVVHSAEELLRLVQES